MAVTRFGWASPEEAIGNSIAIASGERVIVIGVIRNFHLRSLHSRIEPLLLAPSGGNHIAIRSHSGDVTAALDFIKATWQGVFAGYPLVYSILDEDFENLYRVENRLSDLFGVFSLITVFIACLGLLGAASFTAEQRFREIGIRKVLGASISNIVILLSREVTALILLSNVIAWPLAYLVMDRWLQNFAYWIGMGLATFVVGGLLTFLIALLTVSYQSINAACVNPVKSLQYK